ncbi:MAG: DUF5112 domain-containing protein [Prevotella sp.]|nr:DUF5112 domain-containing protein [Prevotella sp.]
MKFWLFIISTILISACSRPDRGAVDKLNSLSYAFHYRNIDSAQAYAVRAYKLSDGYSEGRAEASNNQAFVSIVRMQYDDAEMLLDEVLETSDNQVERMVAYVQHMRLCQRRSRNREFHEYRQLADEALNRINEERRQLSPRQLRRLHYAESEYAIVNSTYYYYVGLEKQSIEALHAINPNEVQRDTAQMLNWLYNIGAGGIITQGTQQEINQQEFDHLMRCFLIARQGDYPFFAANALEALSEHLMDPDYRRQLLADNLPAMKFINPEDVDEDMLSGWLAENALAIFEQYGDIYQIAGAYRTLASCYRQIGDYESALYNLEQALSDSLIYQAPDLVASIREQLSVAYAAIDDKQQSDYNRNLYLDLQETTRQDRQLEARAIQYEKTAGQLNLMLGAVVIAIILLLFSLWLFNHMNRRKRREDIPDDLFEQKREQLAVQRLRVENGERLSLEQRAKISLVNSITPFIDRIIHEVGEKARRREGVRSEETMDYVRELTDQINDYNEVLTYWIQLRQGDLSLHIESFPLQSLFDLLGRGRTSFQMKGVDLEVQPTETVVKADKVLTLFMLNTLADNARKFTPKDGRVTVSARDLDDRVEIAVEDTGQGMTQDQLDHLFDHKIEGGHGFGLLNCKGIIEKYRKVSQIFSVCSMGATSTLGRGSRISFTLPKGIIRLLVALFLLVASLGNSSYARGTLATEGTRELVKAEAFADSAYFSNINGTYERTLFFADSCRYYLNAHYRQLHPHGRYLMRQMGNPSLLAPEIKWFHDSLKTNYQVILDIRNESAVAALALHQWQLYSYNNRIYTQLFKELSADNTLGDYCRTMQQSQTNKTIAVILLVLLLLAIVPAYYLLYYRHRLYDRFLREQQRQNSLEMLDDDIRKAELEDGNLHVSNAVLDNCLSALKHETMYYPSRIRQLLDAGDVEALGEVTRYYRELYGVLSRQAMRQVERATLHLKPLEGGVLGDETLIRYLYEILRRQNGQQRLDKQFTPRDDRYVEVRIPMPQLRLTPEQAADLFTPSKAHIPFLLCRQIVRDHGEATNRRGCGIFAELADAVTTIVITLPAAPYRDDNKKRI